ncbi:unnamed protein product [Dimorphilus gyrociliatus]|uniref:NADH-cytochrome b5 reductase n=1 Tax=Dimorphilus gyrociliatus TaxID=2664684 RepID=A0A7I8VL04_9ANNE|nr:unnamed protein product [Dimorphilus gyrociliatus]
MDNVNNELPPKPKSPSFDDCCGNGCTHCVFDIYEEEVKLWEKECLRIQTGKRNKLGNSKGLSLETYTYLKLSCIEELTQDTKNYTFQCDQLKLEPGKHLLLRWKDEGLTRQYTPISSDENSFKVLIKTYPKGRMSSYIKKWEINDEIEWRGPFGSFQYTPNLYPRICMIAAGTGITPMMPILYSILDNEKDETLIKLIFCCRTYKEILLKEQLDQFSSFWNFKVHYCLSCDNNAIAKYNESLIKSRLNANLIADKLGSSIHQTHFLICGSETFQEDIKACLKSLNVKDHSMFIF